MYLKRLEIKGFKSFPDKIDMEFVNGITAVVGPNGSGKSNISDAIRWVLGEQSARTLRGGKMEDIIFAGTQSRKALGRAEVELTIDNSSGIIPVDYSEITVTRRLYKSGESEYLLNNVSCRLRDIVELFMDTGIGKDGYSLIGQGKIDEIISTRSEDRRNLFEEAAGIVKYKTRKIESERKLENTHQNLVRITDIIEELNMQLDPLKKQSDDAKKYLGYKEELKGIEINSILGGYTSCKNRLQGLLNDIEELSKSKASYEAKREKLISEKVKLRSELENIEKDLASVSSSRIELEKSLESGEGSIRVLQERIENSKKDMLRIENEISGEDNSVQLIKDEIEKLEYEKNTVINELKSLKTNLDSKIHLYDDINKDYSLFEKLMEEHKGEMIQLLKDEADIKNLKSSAQIMVDNLNLRKNQLEKENSIRIEKANLLNESIDKSKALKKDYEEQYGSEKKISEDIKNNISDHEKRQGLLRKQWNDIFQHLKMTEARLKTYTELERDMEGFNRAVKSVISKFKDGEKVFGTISDIIHVPKGYELAIETALGAAIQNIVTDNEITASNIIEYLKSNSLGRATFLPLTTIKPRFSNIPDSVKTIKGYLGTAGSVVSYDDKYKKAISNLLDRTIVCSDLVSARQAAKKLDYSMKIVTLEGDVINSGGSFTGGSNSFKSNGLLTRKSNIESLKQELIKQQQQQKNADRDNEICTNELKELREKYDVSMAKLQELSSSLRSEAAKLEEMINQKNAIDEAISDIAVENEQISIEMQKSKKSIDIQNEKLKKIVEDQSIAQNKTLEITEKSKNLSVKRESESADITSLKILIAEKAKTKEAITDRLHKLTEQRDISSKKISELRELYSSRTENVKKSSEELKSIELLNQEYTDELEKKKNNILSFEASKNKLNDDIASNQKVIDDNDESIKGILISQNKLEVNKAKIESERDSLVNKLWEEYEISIPQAEKYKNNDLSLSDANKRVGELKRAINSLGQINVNAIEEYKKVSERYTFLVEQKNDLNNAEESLTDLISEITTKMRKQFTEKFKIIRENFNQTFCELFGGGFADIQLEEGEVLSSSINIIVQPPGKKLQSISLLSGGEKVLSAIALVFAILKMKPTPFCILDEIEAALDDANVDRFAQFLKLYSQKTQFILITHRKGTMAVADTLYGVTMQEKGVSKLLSLNLKS